MNTIKIALIQLSNYYNNQEEGLKKATKLIEKAASLGANMAFLPELSSCGYIPNQNIWQFAETKNGKTKEWVSQLSKKFNLYIGAGYIELINNDFYNAYLISNPEGCIDGVIYKEDAESYCFKRQSGALSIQSNIGKLGVGICADNHYINRLERMKKENIDLMLMPHANPSPCKTNKTISKKNMEIFSQQPLTIAKAYSNYLGVPTIYVNAVGNFPTFSGGWSVKSFNENFYLNGGSLVVDSYGNLIVKTDHQEGIQVVEVSLEKNHKTKKPHVYHKKWLHQGNALFRYILLPYVTRKGIISYKKNKQEFLKEMKSWHE